MKKTLLACACVLLLSTGGAFAQMQPAPGASSEGNAGPGATKSTTKHTNMKNEVRFVRQPFQHGQCRIRHQKIIRPAARWTPARMPPSAGSGIRLIRA